MEEDVLGIQLEIDKIQDQRKNLRNEMNSVNQLISDLCFKIQEKVIFI
jgi:peptidoglycan hydrolase CwlO-like protein